MKIVLSLVLAFFLVGCSEDNKTDVQKTETKSLVAKEVKIPEIKTTQEKVAVAIEAVTQEVVVAAKEVQKEVEVASVTVVKEVNEVVSEVTAVTKEAVEVATKEIKEVVSKIEAPSIDVKAIYNACAGCHGVDGSKAALGKSKIIKGWSADKVASALNGYKDGTYGGAMKGLMKAQASKLSAEETKAISEYISNL